VSLEVARHGFVDLAHAIQVASRVRWDPSGVLVLGGFPTDDTNAALLHLAHALGTPVPDTRMPGHAMEGNLVYRVEFNPQNQDEHAYSATAGNFPLHTDGAHWKQPPHLVLLLCCRASSSGGDTTLAHVEDVLAQVEAGHIQQLVNVPVGFDDVDAPVLQREPWRIRWNHATLQRRHQRGLWRPHRATLDACHALDVALAGLAARHALRLAPGELLVVDNTRVLHGRTPFVATSNRLLKRVRVRQG